MKLLIEVPKEFEEHFNNDKFVDSLERIYTDMKYGGFPISGNYELELLMMFKNAMANAEVIKE